MNPAKIHISADELQLLQNAEWVLTKNKIIQKVYDLFGFVSEQMQERIAAENLPEEILQSTPKISRGENYNGLPYVMLDYPRVFSKENIFAVRSFFWWGNYFSITLHLRGTYLRMFIDVIQQNIEDIADNNFFIAVSDDEWKHEIDAQSYILLREINIRDIEQFFPNNFLKISAKIEFTEWNNAANRFAELFNVLLKSMSRYRI